MAESSELFNQYKQKFEHLSGWFELLEVNKSKVLNKENTYLIFQCLKCLPQKKVKTHYRAVRSNLKSHVDHVHKACKSEFEKLKPAAQTHGIAVENIDLNSASTTPSHTQSQTRQTKIGENVVSQARVNKLCKDYVINSLMPYYHVESAAFKELVKGLQPTKSIPDYKKVHIMMTEDENQLIENLKNIFSKKDFVACCTDGWSAVRKSWLGYVVLILS